MHLCVDLFSLSHGVGPLYSTLEENVAPFLLVPVLAVTLRLQERDRNLDVGEQEPTVGYALVRSFLLTPFWSGNCASARCR